MGVPEAKRLHGVRGVLEKRPSLGHAGRGRLHWWWKSPLSHRPHHLLLAPPRAGSWKGGDGPG